MKKKTSFVGMLAIAAIQTACFTACSNEEILNGAVQPTEPQKIHVTVGAGLVGDDAQTRSQVVYDETAKTRTLKFTDGDRLYVVGDIDATHRMGGYLDLTSGAGTTSATFSGDLTVWVTDGSTYSVDNSYTLQHANPMDEYVSNTVTATLIHKDAISGSITIDDNTKLCSFNYSKCLVTGNEDNASELMKSGIHVRGTYDATNGKFPLACGDPIFNCNLTLVTGDSGSGSGPSTPIVPPIAPSYFVRIVKDDDNTTYTQTVKADANQNVHFAITTDLSGEGNWKIQVKAGSFSQSTGTIYERPIGNKSLGAKVYNVGNTPNISLSEITSDHIGWIVGSNGKVYPPSTALPSGVSKTAMVCYVSSISPSHGLAIELNGISFPVIWDNTRNVAESKAAVIGGTWRLPSLDDWDNMVNGCGGAEGFITKYGATGMTLFHSVGAPDSNGPNEYWASDYKDGNYSTKEVSWVYLEVYNYRKYTQSFAPNDLGIDEKYYLLCLAF